MNKRFWGHFSKAARFDLACDGLALANVDAGARIGIGIVGIGGEHDGITGHRASNGLVVLNVLNVFKDGETVVRGCLALRLGEVLELNGRTDALFPALQSQEDVAAGLAVRLGRLDFRELFLQIDGELACRPELIERTYVFENGAKVQLQGSLA